MCEPLPLQRLLDPLAHSGLSPHGIPLTLVPVALSPICLPHVLSSLGGIEGSGESGGCICLGLTVLVCAVGTS